VQQRLSAVTLAVADLAGSRRFYEALGWTPGFAGNDVAFYQANGLVLALWDARAFTAETGLPAASGGVCLAHNLPNPTAVDALLRQARAAGAHVIPATRRGWGGHSGHFRDPDGHTWEVAWNPHWPLDARGNVQLAT
jgi:catechol 2,3-dioxygenase-like lactoylglutathione lyase family enzyme